MAYNSNFHPLLYKPMEVSGYWDESNSWHDGCYLNSSLNSPVPVHEIEGPDAEKFLEKYIVNSLENRPVGKGFHAVFCNDEGKIVADGIVVKRGEHKYRAYLIMMIGILAQMEAGNFDIKVTELTGTLVLYQFCGPRALELMEAVTGTDLHSLKFMCYAETSIDGMPVDILRVGMAGTLGYEIHCRMEDSVKVYQKVMTEGEKYGLRHLGWQTYRNAHTEGGFPQSSVHYWYADYMHATDGLLGQRDCPEKPGAVSLAPPDADPNDLLSILSTIYLDGSLSDEPFSAFTCTPYDVGWEKMIRFDHEFIGRSALEAMRGQNTRTVVTLEWEPEDIAKVWNSVFEEGKPYKRMDLVADQEPYGEFEYFPSFNATLPAGVYMEFDRVYIGDQEIGFTSGRMFSPHYRKMISLAFIPRDQAKIGEEVEILWGNPGTRQIRIRAKIARYPYVDQCRNEKMDVSAIPHGNN